MNIPAVKEITGEELQSMLNSVPTVKSDFNMIITSLRRRQLAGKLYVCIYLWMNGWNVYGCIYVSIYVSTYGWMDIRIVVLLLGCMYVIMYAWLYVSMHVCKRVWLYVCSMYLLYVWSLFCMAYISLCMSSLWWDVYL
jgi:hypothetical protein